jgi:dihydrodiol dehydrogenase / D-xylose 1-dehydrogenase (NADP)
VFRSETSNFNFMDISSWPGLDITSGATRGSDAAFPLRWGILGCGSISADWCRALKEGAAGATLAAVAARDPARAAAFAAQHGDGTACTPHRSYAALVADPRVDIVYVGTVTARHKEHALLAIAAGKHVVCEKPLALCAADAAEMYAAARAKGVMLQEGMWTRFFPAVEHARALLAGGELGEVRSVHADFADMCYAVQYAPLAFGADREPAAVGAAGAFSKSSCGAGASGAVVSYTGSGGGGGGGCAVLSFPAWASEFPEVAEIVCARGRLTLDLWGSHPTRLTVSRIPGSCFEAARNTGHCSTSQNGVLPAPVEVFDYPLASSGVAAGYEAGKDTGWHYVNQRGFAYQVAAVHRCLAAGLRECPQFTAADSLRTLQLLDAIEAQCEAQHPPAPLMPPITRAAPAPPTAAAAAPARLELVVIGCGVPKFSMGWTHLFQLQQPPLTALAEVVGVVEPFFLGQEAVGGGGASAAKGAEEFRAWMAAQQQQQPQLRFAASCSDLAKTLPPVAPGVVRLAIIAVRAAESAGAFREAVEVLGCRAAYLEKPGASSVRELDAMVGLAADRGVTVLMGYSRNLGTYVPRAQAYAKELAGRAGATAAADDDAATDDAVVIKLLHSNPWRDEELDECFARCQPGLLYDMACHDLAIAVAHYGLTADGFGDLQVDPALSLQQVRGGVQDFVRLAFSLRPRAADAFRLAFVIDRQTGAFNGMEVGEGASRRRFLSGEPPLLFPNPLPDLSPHLACQYDYYVEAKRVLLESVAAAAPALAADPRATAALPEGAPTLQVAREVLLLAEKLTKLLQQRVPIRIQNKL